MKVVIVDDNVANAVLAKVTVQHINDVEPLIFNDPQAALEWCSANQPDLILLDQNMPDLCGIDFLRQYRITDEEHSVPIVMLTAMSDQKILCEALEAGATEFLSKPFDTNELLARTRNLLKMRENHLELKKTIENLHYLATTDTMTKIANRAHFLERLNEEIDRARRFQSPMTIALMDADRFKLVNDTFGHAAGDRVLIELANTAKAVLRSHDIVGRIGGEEFAICMPETTLEKAIQVCDRLRGKISQTAINSDDHTILATVSIGVSQFDPEHDTADSLMCRVDTLLYQAKESGRNRTVGYKRNEMAGHLSALAS